MYYEHGCEKVQDRDSRFGHDRDRPTIAREVDDPGQEPSRQASGPSIDDDRPVPAHRLAAVREGLRPSSREPGTRAVRRESNCGRGTSDSTRPDAFRDESAAWPRGTKPSQSARTPCVQAPTAGLGSWQISRTRAPAAREQGLVGSLGKAIKDRATGSPVWSGARWRQPGEGALGDADDDARYAAPAVAFEVSRPLQGVVDRLISGGPSRASARRSGPAHRRGRGAAV